jgi:predicted dehydrogenase
MRELRLGLIGLDTSHVDSLASHFNDAGDPHRVAGGRIVAAFPGGSADFPLSANRVSGYTEKLRTKYRVEMLGSPREVADAADAVILTSVDGRVHRTQWAAIAAVGKPVFIDKPFATTSADARAMADLARQHGARVFSSSSIRFAGAFQSALADASGGNIFGADFFGPISWQETQPGFYWYGVHTVEALYAAFGRGCATVSVFSTPQDVAIVARWRDGRVGVIRGNLTGNYAFGGVLQREKSRQWIDFAAGTPSDVGVAQAMMAFFQGGPSPVDLEDTVEITRFLEAANLSMSEGGRTVNL